MAIDNGFSLQSPQASAKRLRELNGIAHTIWSKYFQEREDLKNETKSIFMHMIAQFQEKTFEVVQI